MTKEEAIEFVKKEATFPQLLTIKMRGAEEGLIDMINKEKIMRDDIITTLTDSNQDYRSQHFLLVIEDVKNGDLWDFASEIREYKRSYPEYLPSLGWFKRSEEYGYIFTEKDEEDEDEDSEEELPWRSVET